MESDITMTEQMTNECPGCGSMDCTPANCPAYVTYLTSDVVSQACLAYGPGAFPGRMRKAADVITEPLAAKLGVALDYIRDQSCTCTPELAEDADPCARCAVLARLGYPAPVIDESDAR